MANGQWLIAKRGRPSGLPLYFTSPSPSGQSEPWSVAYDLGT